MGQVCTCIAQQIASTATSAGIQTDPSGDSYTGEWVNNKRHGQGEQLLANGDIFVGVFANHARYGAASKSKG